MTLDEARDRIGQLVVYRTSYMPVEEGVITSVNGQFVFVRYGTQQTSNATYPENLEAVSR